MPLTKKGKKIKRAMMEEYGSERGEQVFYASANKGRIKSVYRRSAEPEDFGMEPPKKMKRKKK